MAFVSVIVVDLDNHEWEAQVNPDSNFATIESDIIQQLGLSLADGYHIRSGGGKICEGSILVIDKGQSLSAKLGTKRR